MTSVSARMLIHVLGYAVRGALETLARKALQKACQHLEVREVRTGDDLFLSRYVLKDGGRDGWRCFLHCFHRPDRDQELHNHPWAVAAALQLIGGYEEERRTGDGIVQRRVMPGQINWLTANTFHRVSRLLQQDSWSLIVAGPISQSWGFWHRDTDAFTPWREFVSRSRG